MINRWSLVWFGIRFRFHPLFSIIVLLSALTGYFVEIITLFGIVLIHELGHAAAAKGLGWKVKEVQLLPFGGVAVVEEHSDIPVWQDLTVALAGPLQNAWMMAVGSLLAGWGLLPPVWGAYFVQANLLIGLFNMLPIFPLDGGKVLLALFGLWLPYEKTIRLTVWISLVFSGLMLCASALHLLTEKGGLQLNLLMIGLFLLYSNWYELRGIPYRFVRFLVNRPVRQQGLLSRGTAALPIVVLDKRRVTEIVRLFMRDRYHLIYVLDERGALRHIVPEKTMLDFYFDEGRRDRPLAELFLL
ncbi:M50 family metallopeptidase [Paenibacillus filicis]|uniref:M50 family metallopeptidase n=1 Tax=Paenibacillus gyeongsangnamensis TaxID=3388067 RepID=A0ABT4Q8Y8_9BACL|nr:M50 family metallopeptidase [Paenibacillus filicis]MCZ8513354.1 M50 family metallopeptidase [Paenibacillus filicis]